MAKYLLITICFILPAAGASSQTLKKRYESISAKNDPVAEEQFLKEWEETNCDDPELYTAFFNYYTRQSLRENIVFEKEKPLHTNYLILNNADFTKKEPSTYIYNNISYDKKLIGKVINYVEKGIGKFPSRLDMRFGLIHLYKLLGRFDDYTTEILDVINHSAHNGNEWLWTEGTMLPDGKKTMLEGMQGYILELYEARDSKLINNMMQIAEITIEYYPNDVQSHLNQSIVFLLCKEYDRALSSLSDAEKLNPKDILVLGNMAQAYKLKGDKANAIRYYKMMAEQGDADARNYAMKQIKKIEGL